LPARELVAGWCECVKQGAVGSRKLFNQTTQFLNLLNSQRNLVSSELEQLIASHCAFKASIVATDELAASSKFWSHHWPCSGGPYQIQPVSSRRSGGPRNVGGGRAVEKSRTA
jgi:hypothetical protein